MEKYIVEVYHNRTVWRNEEGQYHRLNGPAVEYSNGDYVWCQNGTIHRTDGPAMFIHGCEQWLNMGVFHRTDGPAKIFANGDKEYFKDGYQYTEEEFNTCNKPFLGKKVTVKGVQYTLS